jgi:hypothetical protein
LRRPWHGLKGKRLGPQSTGCDLNRRRGTSGGSPSPGHPRRDRHRRDCRLGHRLGGWTSLRAGASRSKIRRSAATRPRRATTTSTADSRRDGRPGLADALSCVAVKVQPALVDPRGRRGAAQIFWSARGLPFGACRTDLQREWERGRDRAKERLSYISWPDDKLDHRGR